MRGQVFHKAPPQTVVHTNPYSILPHHRHPHQLVQRQVLAHRLRQLLQPALRVQTILTIKLVLIALLHCHKKPLICSKLMLLIALQHFILTRLVDLLNITLLVTLFLVMLSNSAQSFL